MTRPPPLAARLGAVVRELRRARGLGQATLAAAIGCDQRHISRLEIAAGDPSLAMVERIAAAFAMPAWELLRLAEESTTRAGGLAGDR